MLWRPSAADEFWSWFRDHARLIASMNVRTAETRRLTADDEELVARLADALAEVDPRIFPYTGLARDGIHELILSTDGNAAAFPAVFALTRNAPMLEGWRIVPLKQRSGVAGRIGGGGVSLDCEKLRFFLDHEFDPPVLVLLADEDIETNFEAFQFLGSAVALQVLGEHDFAASVSEIGVISRREFERRWGHDGAPLEDLGKAFPPKPLH